MTPNDGGGAASEPQGATWHTTDAGHAPAYGEGLREIDVDLLRPGRYQPRRNFAQETLEELANSIRAEGVVQPIIVRPLPGSPPQRYEIIAGERRWRAAQLAGLRRIPAVVRAVDDRAALVQSLVENIQRENLNPVEEARGVERLIAEFGLTHQETAQRLGRSRDGVTHLLRILKLDPEVLRQVKDGTLTFGHAKLLVGQPTAWQRFLAGEVAHDGLSVRALAQRIRSLDGGARSDAASAPKRDADIARLEQRVGELVGAQTRVDYEPDRGRGRISFSFHSLEALEGILERLGYSEQ